MRQMGTPDEHVTAWLDNRHVWERKEQALRAHRSQIPDDWFLLNVPEELRQRSWAPRPCEGLQQSRRPRSRRGPLRRAAVSAAAKWRRDLESGSSLKSCSTPCPIPLTAGRPTSGGGEALRHATGRGFHPRIGLLGCSPMAAIRQPCSMSALAPAASPCRLPLRGGRSPRWSVTGDARGAAERGNWAIDRRRRGLVARCPGGPFHRVAGIARGLRRSRHRPLSSCAHRARFDGGPRSHRPTSLGRAGSLYRKLHGLDRPDGPTADDLIAVVEEVTGATASVERWRRPGDLWFESWDEATAYYGRRLVLPRERWPELTDLLVRG